MSQARRNRSSNRHLSQAHDRRKFVTLQSKTLVAFRQADAGHDLMEQVPRMHSQFAKPVLMRCTFGLLHDTFSFLPVNRGHFALLNIPGIKPSARVWKGNRKCERKGI